MNAVRLVLAGLCYCSMAVLVVLHLLSFTLWGGGLDKVLFLGLATFPLYLCISPCWHASPKSKWSQFLGFYAFFNFFYCLFALHFGTPECHDGQYYFSNHGTITPATALEYAWGREHELRLATGHLAYFYVFLAEAFAGKFSEWPLKPAPAK